MDTDELLKSLMTDNEQRALVLAFALARDGQFTPDELGVLINKAREITMNWLSLSMVYQGALLVDLQDGRLVFSPNHAVTVTAINLKTVDQTIGTPMEGMLADALAEVER